MYTARDVQRLARAADLPDYEDKNLLYRFHNSEKRKETIRSSVATPDKKVAAAIELQRTWRGYRTRKILYSILSPSSATLSYLSSNCTSPTYQEIRESLNSSPLSCRAHSVLSKGLSRIQSSYVTYTENQETEENKQKLWSFQGFSAWTIQRWWRGILERLREAEHIRNNPVISEESFKSNGSVRVLSQVDAAVIVQKAWRKHIDLQVFQYYKQLINFHNKGDPHFMLKCINPKEAELLDDAAGIHIRFRLGGVKFPPNIYYKIFTHINVADVGAFSPRNYTDPSTKQLPGKFIHNTGFQIQGSAPSDWYERHENNGWRLVSDRVMKFLNTDPIVYETSKAKKTFNHEKLVRRQDMEAKRKQKKINWMRKVYKAGMLKTDLSDGEDRNDVRDLVEAAAKGIVMLADESGIDAVKDSEVDELLHWTNGLNFDSYLQDWQESGTTCIQTDFRGFAPSRDPVATMLQEKMH